MKKVLIGLALAMVLVFSATVWAQEEATDTDSRFKPDAFIGPYVTVQQIQGSEVLPNGVRRPTGKALEDRYLFRTLEPIMKERGDTVSLAGAENAKARQFVGKFSQYCTEKGFKLATDLMDLRVKLGEGEYPALENFTMSWDGLVVYKRTFFEWGDILPKIAEMFEKAGFAPKGGNDGK